MTLTVTIYSDIAQLVEQVTVNHWVAGSSPAVGASLDCLLVLMDNYCLMSGNQSFDAGWRSPVTHQSHKLEIAGSNPAPATNSCVSLEDFRSGSINVWSRSRVSRSAHLILCRLSSVGRATDL